MPNLSAKFNIELASPCQVEFPDGQTPTLESMFSGFTTVVRLIPSSDGRRWQLKGNPHWTTFLDSIELTLTRNEVSNPPAVVTTSNGNRDLSALSAWLRPLLPEYRAAAVEATRRILGYFKFTLSTPLVQLAPLRAPGFDNPIWLDSAGAALPTALVTITVEPIAGEQGELGVKKLTLSDLPSLADFLQAPQSPTLDAELLSDAQAAYFERNLRRAVLELAICTEITVKRLFFAAASPAGAAFDYLEDKARISVRVLDLLDGVAMEAFSQSFKEFDSAAYRQIDHMFRCRNKIAHRGELSYRDDGGRVTHVDESIVKDWWGAVAGLRTWASSLQG